MARPIEARPMIPWPVEFEVPQETPRPVVEISLAKPLSELPTAQNPCHYCGGARQREFSEYEASTDTLVVLAIDMPVYGCTECPRKSLYEPIVLEVLSRAVREAAARGDRASALQFQHELELLKESNAPVSSGT